MRSRLCTGFLQHLRPWLKPNAITGWPSLVTFSTDYVRLDLAH